MIYFNGNISKIYSGGYYISEVYLGNSLVWKAGGSFIAPEEDGDYLIIRQVYSATENGDYLEVE